MALALTARASATAIFGGTVAITSPSFTPSDNSLLFVVGGVGNGGGTLGSGGWSISNAGAALSWEQVFFVADSNGADVYALVVYVAEVASHAAMTVTLSHSDAASSVRLNLHVFDITGGADPNVSISVSQASLGSGSFSFNLPSPPTIDDIVIGCRIYEDSVGGSAAATPGSTYSEVYDTNPDPDGWTGLQTQQRTGSTSTVVDWVDVAANGSSEIASAALGFIVRALVAPAAETLIGGAQTMVPMARRRWLGY